MSNDVAELRAWPGGDSSSAADLAAVARGLIREYADGLPYSLCFQGLEEELRTLPGKYAPPDGQLIVAYVTGNPVACIAFRALPSEAGGGPAAMGPCCEMKRLYVRPSFRGRGLARMLCDRLLSDARNAGYARMRLDSDERDMRPATMLYESIGFVRIPPYNDDPIAATVWMEKTL